MDNDYGTPESVTAEEKNPLEDSTAVQIRNTTQGVTSVVSSWIKFREFRSENNYTWVRIDSIIGVDRLGGYSSKVLFGTEDEVVVAGSPDEVLIQIINATQSLDDGEPASSPAVTDSVDLNSQEY